MTHSFPYESGLMIPFHKIVVKVKLKNVRKHMIQSKYSKVKRTAAGRRQLALGSTAQGMEVPREVGLRVALN